MKLKCGIIGYGYMGKIRHKVIDENPNLKLVGICDFNKLLIPHPMFYSTQQELIESDIDIIFVCTPNAFSPEIVMSALSHGKHVFCEKPPGRNLDDIKNIIATEKAHPHLKLMFGFNHRYHPAIQEAKKYIDSKILYIKGTYGKSNMQNWRAQKDISGGGILLDQGIHMLDLFRYFCKDFNKIQSTITKKGDIEDNAFLILSNENQVVTLHSSATMWKHTFTLEIGLENSYLTVNGLLSKTGSYGRETLTIGYRASEDNFALGNPREEIIYFDTDNSWKIEVENFVECIVRDKVVEDSSSQDAFEVMNIIDEVYKGKFN